MTVEQPKATATAPASQPITEAQKVAAFKDLETSVRGKLENHGAIVFISQIGRALSRIDDSKTLIEYLESMQSEAYELRHNQQIELAERNLLTAGLKIVAEKCGVELKGIAEGR